MLFKGILCIFILLAGIGIGHLKAKTYDNRVYHLQELITTLKVMESEMKYRLDPMPDLLLRISKIKVGMSTELMETASRLLRDQTSRDLADCWKEAVDTAYLESALNKEDKRIITDLGIELGKTDMESQSGMFLRTFSLLEAQTTEAIEEKKTKGKMYKSLGSAIGILIVILLI
ncbi:MAG TPA: stage III sporulation protein AB [Anaerovoracaceae bacterium]|nr:stage III sporulation protein AB [Anaerovoracaceae bacterium]